MNKTLSEAAAYAAALREGLAVQWPHARIFVVPPFTALKTVCDILKDSGILVGAQNMHWQDHGAWTGEISPPMLADVGVGLVELGHSERRAACGETDGAVNRKVLAALAHDLRPLICVGDTAAERDAGAAAESVVRQVKIAVQGVPGSRLPEILFAYEPVWAIGESGTVADPEDAGRMHQVIRSALAGRHGRETAARVPILYGGSVHPRNVPAFAAQPSIDGLFIGRASWDVHSFIACIKAFERSRNRTTMARGA